MAEDNKQSKLTLTPTKGVTDYASQYKTIIKDRKQLIDSAKYFMRMRRSHLTEVLGSYDDFIDNVTYEEAALILNEFLSPTCTLLEFEYKNLTKAGKEKSEEEKSAEAGDSMNEVWQKHILGRVLTNESHNQFISIPANASFMFAGKKKEVKKGENAGDGESSSGSKEDNIEIFTVYKRLRWFVKNIDINKLNISRFARADVKKAIDDFNDSFTITWKAVTCLVYLQLIVSMHNDSMTTVDIIFGRIDKLLADYKRGIESKDSSDMLKVSNLFILKYFRDSSEEDLLRGGFEYLAEKLNVMNANKIYHPSIMSVSACMAFEEAKIFGIYNMIKEFYDFSTCTLQP